MLNSKRANAPINFNENLEQDDGDDAKKLRCLFGGLNYLNHNDPDIAYSVGSISRFMQQLLKKSFCFTAIEYGIMYSKVPTLKLYKFIG